MRTLHRLALASALALAGAARAGDVTYPQLNTATTVLDTDLIATWRASGPLTKVQASVLEAYLQGKLSPLFLLPANNLSDLANVGTARTNLGLGSAAQASVGMSGTALCQLNSNCTWAGTEAFNGKVTHGASTSSGALFNLTPGAAPTSPVNGDFWDTSTGLFAYLNGATQQIAFTSSSITGNAATATNANFATNAGTASNANALGGVAAGNFVQNNGGTYSINITGTAGSAGSANTANSATNANNANTVGGRSSSGVALAWAFFQGSSINGSVTIWSSFNVGLVQRNATGNYGIGFSAGMSSGAYAPVAICFSNGVSNNIMVTVANGSNTSSGFTINTVNTQNNGVDCNNYAIVVFG